jgi:hypothetical protein
MKHLRNIRMYVRIYVRMYVRTIIGCTLPYANVKADFRTILGHILRYAIEQY